MCGTIGDDRKNVHFYLKERILDSEKSSLDRPLIVPLLEVDPSSKILAYVVCYLRFRLSVPLSVGPCFCLCA